MVNQDPAKLVILSLHQRGPIRGRDTAMPILGRTKGGNSFCHTEDRLSAVLQQEQYGSTIP
jgi:hypothetical protein